MTADLYVRNAHLVTEDGERRGGFLVTGGTVERVVDGDPDLAADATLDAGGLVVLPGLVDGHVHFSEPGRTHWEGFETGTRAAAAGGVTTVVEMPLNAHPPTTTGAALALKQEAASRSAVVDYALWGGLVDDNRAALDELFAGGVVGFKAFLCEATDFPRIDDDILRDGLAKARALGSFVAVHAENQWVTRDLRLKLLAEGRTDRRAWGESRPIAAEIEAIQRALFWAQQTAGRLHVVHISCAAGVDLVAAAKREGVAVTAETCPHYLVFSDDDLVARGPLAKCAPPLRAPAERAALWDRVLGWGVDVIGSDHSPCLIEEKTIGDADIFQAWGGISGLQSTLPALATHGVKRRGLPWADVVRMTASNPARLFGLHPRKGTLAPGADADFVLFDPEASFVLRTEDLFYRNPHSVYVGETFQGRVVETWVRGRRVMADGTVVAPLGSGRLLRPDATETADHLTVS